MAADWAIVLATLAFGLTVLTPIGKIVGVWAGSEDTTASTWQRHYGRPAVGFYVVGAIYFALLAAWTLFTSHPWIALLPAALAVLEIVGGVLCVRGPRQGRTRSVM